MDNGRATWDNCVEEMKEQGFKILSQKESEMTSLPEEGASEQCRQILTILNIPPVRLVQINGLKYVIQRDTGTSIIYLAHHK